MGLIFLTGMTGVGKTTIGRDLAQKLSMQFFDLDEQIEKLADRSIPQIFSEHGEPGFRKLESAALVHVLDHTSAVIALGAGALENDDNFRQVQEAGLLVYLRTPIEALVSRCMKLQNRPMFAAATNEPEIRDTLAKMFERRRLRYESAAIIVDMTGKTPAEVTDEIAVHLKS